MGEYLFTRSTDQEYPISDRLRVNEQIRAREVRVIDDASGKQLGIFPPREATAMARERNLDLVEVAPNANPPVCRIMDYGKFQYERTKKEREAKKAQKVIEVKEVRIRPKTAMYHVGFKLNRVRDWIKKGNKVKIRILFRAREITHSNLGRETLEQIAGDMADIATVEQAPLMDGKSLVMLLGPGAQKGGADAARRAIRFAKTRPPADEAAALAAMPASTSVVEADDESETTETTKESVV
ncbi:MAG: translation initiation factor IF-3 [Anaerolineae bacterium]|nr:translation initiation factor IF-3 [Anaerolineae bacterium]